GEKFEFNNLLFGRHLDLVFGIAVAIGLEYSLTVSQITEALSLMKFSDRRFDVTKLSNGAYLVDDSYNASFDSMKLAIEGLEDVSNGKKVLVLGDMKELGEQSTDSHLRVGKVAATADYLFTIGELGRVIAEGAIKAGMKTENVTSLPDLKNMDEVNSLADAIIKKISNNDVVLVKASRSMALDRVANSIKTKIG